VRMGIRASASRGTRRSLRVLDARAEVGSARSDVSRWCAVNGRPIKSRQAWLGRVDLAEKTTVQGAWRSDGEDVDAFVEMVVGCGLGLIIDQLRAQMWDRAGADCPPVG
jgi:hypothetical protein